MLWRYQNTEFILQQAFHVQTAFFGGHGVVRAKYLGNPAPEVLTVIGIEGFRDLDPQLGKMADKWYLGYRTPDADILRSPKLNPNGFLTDQDVFGDMTELITGKVPGREREDEIIVSTHMGMGAHDVVCADIVYQRARLKGIGQTLILA